VTSGPEGGRFSAEVIVIGAGSAGATATRRLVDRGMRVLLLEAGGVDSSPAIHDPARLFELWYAPEDWAYETVPQEHAQGRQLHWPRGKVLGGSSSLNAMIYVRGSRLDYDHWAYLGNAGWSWDDVLPVFKRMENYDSGDPDLHGRGGPLNVMTRYQLDPIQESILAAGREAGLPLDLDYNDGDPEGISAMHFSIKDGERHSTARAYLAPILQRPNLQLLTDAHARRLIFDGTRCIGVEWERNGSSEQGIADVEVIVCAGAIESPRVLMLSGIGDADHLRSLGIDVTVDLPGVGCNLHDHLLSPVILSADREIGPPSPGLPSCQTHLFWRSRPGLVVPDMQPLHFMVPMYQDWMEGPPNGFTFQAGIIRPVSRGTIRLKSADMWDEMLIDPATLAAEADVDSLVAAVVLCREMGATTPLRDWGVEERYPGPDVSVDGLREYVRRTAVTYHHQVGTCKMGVDGEAVVDPELRVYGTERLRVADASIMPAVISGNTNAPSIMIGERVADFVAANQR
jgi:choline dehydrogenase